MFYINILVRVSEENKFQEFNEVLFQNYTGPVMINNGIKHNIEETLSEGLGYLFT